MSGDELNHLLEQMDPSGRERGMENAAGAPARTRNVQRELDIRVAIDEWREELEAVPGTRRSTTARDRLESWGIGDGDQYIAGRRMLGVGRGGPGGGGRDLTPEEQEEKFDQAVVLFHALSRMAEDGMLDEIHGISPDTRMVTDMRSGEQHMESSGPGLKDQVETFGNSLYRRIGEAPGLTPGSTEAAVAKMRRGRHIHETHLRTILGHRSSATATEGPDHWKTLAWQQMAWHELARREARDFDLSIPKEQRSQFNRSLRERSTLAPEPMGKEELVALAMRRLRLAEEDRDETRLGQKFGTTMMETISDRHYLDDVEMRPRSESPESRFAEGEAISEEDLLEVFEGPMMRRPDEELHTRAMETPEERGAGKRTAEEEADQRLDELIASIDELSAPRNRVEEVAGRDTEATFEQPPGARRADAFMSRRDMTKQRAARNPQDRSIIKQSSPFFKIVYDSLDVEIKKERDPVKRKALEKLKKSFEYFNSSSIRYGPENPYQTSDAIRGAGTMDQEV